MENLWHELDDVLWIQHYFMYKLFFVAYIFFPSRCELWKGKPLNINFLELPLSCQHIGCCVIQGTISPLVLKAEEITIFSHVKLQFMSFIMD